MTKKECPVCVLLNLDSDFGNYIDTLLKRDTKISEVIVELTNRNYSVPSEHYLKKHKINCLKNFVITISECTSLPINNVVGNTESKTSDVNSLNILTQLEKYRNMNLQEKEADKLNRLKEIEFMCSVTIHHQLIYGRSSLKAIVPKEDIGALKQIEDILKNIEDIEDKKPKELPTIFLQVLDKDGNVTKTERLGGSKDQKLDEAGKFTTN